MSIKLTQQQAIDKRMAQIKRNGINDRAEGLPPMPGQALPYYEGYKQQSERAAGEMDCIMGLDPQRDTIDYTIGYGDKYQRQQIADNLTSMQA